MAETESLPPAPEAETQEPRQNNTRENLGQWGEPINFTIPAPFADMVRNIVNTHQHGNGFRHRSMRRMGRGFHGRGRGGRRGGPSREHPPQKNNANTEEVSEEVKALRQALEEVKEEETREAEAVNPIVETPAPSEAAWAAIPTMIREKIEEAKVRKERVPSWVEQMLVDFEAKVAKEKEQKPKEVEEAPLVQATPIEKDAFETDQEETAPWLQNGDRKKFAEERMKRFSKDKKCGKHGKGQKDGKHHPGPHGFGGPHGHGGPHGFGGPHGPRGRPGPGGPHRGMGPGRGRSSERKFVGNIGPFEMELTLTQTEKLVPNKNGKMKGNKEGKCKGNKLNKEEKMAKKEARMSAKQAQKEARMSAKLANKEAKMEKKAEKKEEKEIKQAVKKAEKAAKKDMVEVKGEPFYPVEAQKEKEVAPEVEPQGEQGALTQAELFQLFEVLKKEFKKQ